MFHAKNSHILIIIFFLFSGNSFGQTPGKENKDPIKDSAGTKPHTISLKSGQRIHSAVASDNETTLYISDTEGSLYSYDLETKQQNWSADLGGKTVSGIVSFANRVYIVTSVFETDSTSLTGGSTIWEIDEMSGLTLNKIKLPEAGQFYLFNTDMSVVVVSLDSSVSVFEKGFKKTNGQNNLHNPQKKLVHKPIFDLKNLVLFLIYPDNIIKFSINNSEQISVGKIDLKNTSVSAFYYSDPVFLIGDAKGSLGAFNREGFQKIWRFRAGGKISFILVFGNKILAASYDNFLYCLNASDGNIIWKKRFPGRITDVQRVSETNFAVKTSYANDLFFADILTGNIDDKFILPKNTANQIEVITTSRLIMIQQSYTIDIYTKN